jgi:uncharacterized protein (DUF2141 family)
MTNIAAITGCISASGTGFAARIAGLGLLAALSLGAGEPASLDLSIAGLRSAKGNVLVCLTANAKAFPDCAKDTQARKMIVPAAKAAKIHFADLAPGIYAIALVHDENANGKMDIAIMIPREGFGFSRNAMGSFGPPKFAAAQFGVAPGENAQAVKIKYML